MFRVFKWFLRWICLGILICSSVALVRTGLNPLRSIDGWGRLLTSPYLWVAAAGWGFRFLLTRLWREDPLEFLDTLEHELTHALTGYLTLAPPVSLNVTLRKGGEVELSRGNPIAVLSPYFLPLYAGLTAGLTFVLKPDMLPYGRYAVAFLLGSFVHRFLKEFHLGQTDFRVYGFVFSLAFIAALLPLSTAVLLNAARIWHVSWSHGVWPLFMEQGRWLGRMISGVFRRPG